MVEPLPFVKPRRAAWLGRVWTPTPPPAVNARLPPPRSAVDPHGYGLTLVHFSAQRERLQWDRGCA